mgnify:CR=1 FL=1
MGREFELKYRADAEKIAAIREQYGDFTSISMETTYYDTPGHALGDLHWTLRRRMENGVSETYETTTSYSPHMRLSPSCSSTAGRVFGAPLYWSALPH